jgi:hypothetical protein
LIYSLFIKVFFDKSSVIYKKSAKRFQVYKEYTKESPINLQKYLRQPLKTKENPKRPTATPQDLLLQDHGAIQVFELPQPFDPLSSSLPFDSSSILFMFVINGPYLFKYI